MAPSLRFDGPADAPMTVALAHGAGAPMDSRFMQIFAEGLAARGLRVARFEFPYMAARREDGRRRPPDREPTLRATWHAVIQALEPERLVIGGKSMGGRIASLIADEAGVAGLVCLGYPFHPAGRPEKTRTAHLESIRCATLIVQGTRDAMGSRDDVASYTLSEAIAVHWIEDGNHDLAPRKSSGRSEAQNWDEAMDAVAAFATSLSPRSDP